MKKTKQVVKGRLLLQRDVVRTLGPVVSAAALRQVNGGDPDIPLCSFESTRCCSSSAQCDPTLSEN
jgi:hypothetical protein